MSGLNGAWRRAAAIQRLRPNPGPVFRILDEWHRIDAEGKWDLAI